MSDDKGSTLLYRRGLPKDVPFITNSWLKSFREGGVWSRHIPNNVYYHFEHELINKLLPRSFVLVVCNKADPDQILGYCVSQVVDTALVIHYLYVKHTFRRLNIAKQMVRELKKSSEPPAIMYTHRTPIVNKLIFSRRDRIEAGEKVDRHEVDSWVYNPFLAYMNLKESNE